MNDPNNPTPPSNLPSTSNAEVTQQEIDAGKAFAALCYLPIGPIGLIFTIICLVQKNNHFSLYHAKQSLMLYITFVVLVIPVFILTLIMTMVLGAVTARMGGFGGCFGLIFYFAYFLGALALVILGIVNAMQGKMKPLPVIGAFAEKWFAGIKKVGA